MTNYLRDKVKDTVGLARAVQLQNFKNQIAPHAQVGFDGGGKDEVTLD